MLEAIHKLSHPVLDVLFQGITLLGEQMVLAGLFCLIYWCIDRKAGTYLLICLCMGTCLNGLVKDIVKAPRPFWEEGVTALRTKTATGYSFPSGHSQTAATVFSALALWVRKRWMTVTSSVIILLVGFSRLYLGVHYPRDVIVGIILGVFTAWLAHILFQKLPLKRVAMICALLAVISLLFAESADTYAAAGLAIGMLPGLWLASKVEFHPPASVGRGALRLLAGGALLGAVYLPPKLIFEKSKGLYLILSIAVAFMGVGVYPWLVARFSREKQGKIL